MSFAATNDASAGAIFQSVAQAAGVDVSHLGQVAQLQLALANSMSGNIPDTVSTLTFSQQVISTTALATPSAFAATTGSFFASTVSGATLMGYGTTGDVTLKNRAGTDTLVVTANTVNVALAGNLTTTGEIQISGTAAAPAATVRYIGSPSGSASNMASNVPSGGTLLLRVAGVTWSSFGANTMNFGVAGNTYNFVGATGSGADQASSATTFKAMVGTGAGAVGGLVFQVPITHGSDSVAQTLTTVLTLGATTTVSATFAGTLTVTGTTALNNVTTITSTTASQLKVAYDGSNHVTVDVSSAGAVTLNATGASAGFTFSDPVTMSGATTFSANLLVGGSVGATAAKTIALSNSATAPTTSVDLCHLYCADISAGHASLAIYSEEVVNAAAAVASTHRLPITINGTQYAVLLTTVLS